VATTQPLVVGVAAPAPVFFGPKTKIDTVLQYATYSEKKRLERAENARLRLANTSADIKYHRSTLLRLTRGRVHLKVKVSHEHVAKRKILKALARRHWLQQEEDAETRELVEDGESDVASTELDLEELLDEVVSDSDYN